MDRHYRKGMTLDEAKDVLRKCILEVRVLFLLPTNECPPGDCLMCCSSLGANALHCQPAGIQGALR